MAQQTTLNTCCRPAVPQDAKVVILGDSPAAVSDAWPNASTDAPTSDSSQRYDLAVLIHTSDESDAKQLSHRLAAARDQWAKQVLVLVPLKLDNAAVESEYFALGFSHRQLPDGLAQQFRAYGYAISNYKTTPDWLNKKYWANPERWTKN